jgi:hypothetical protein
LRFLGETVPGGDRRTLQVVITFWRSATTPKGCGWRCRNHVGWEREAGITAVESKEHLADHPVRLINAERVAGSRVCRIWEGQKSVDRVVSRDVLLCSVEEVLKQQELTMVKGGFP